MSESEVQPINLSEKIVTPFFEIPVSGHFSKGEVEIIDTGQNFKVEDKFKKRIEEIWQSRKNQVEAKGGHLQDRPKLVVLDKSIKSGKLSLILGHSSYKYYVGLGEPELKSVISQEKLPKFLGAAALLETSDGYLVLNERSQTVFQYNGWLSVFTGSTEPDDLGDDGVVDPFVTAIRETREEVQVDNMEIADIVCLGYMTDKLICADMMLFHIKTTLTKEGLENIQRNKNLDEGKSVFLPINADDVRKKVLEFSKVFVSDGASVLALFGKDKFGQDWFENVINRLRRRGNVYNLLSDEQRKSLEDRLILRLTRN